jgi:dephospho-CoA kinase
MFVTRVLVTGMSGTGKSAALSELASRGFRVVDTDEPGWSVWVENPAEAGGGEWLWVEERMSELLAEDGEAPLFVSGCVRNQGSFYDRFDAVVLLSAAPETILDRLATRSTNDYGKDPRERALIMEQLETVEPLLRKGCTHELDAGRPLGEVVAELVRVSARP